MSQIQKSSILEMDFIQKTVKDILNRYGIHSIYLFGSYARKEATKDSDVDILCERGDIKTLIQKEFLIEELEFKLEKEIDLVFLDAEMPEHFRKTIEKDLIKLS